MKSIRKFNKIKKINKFILIPLILIALVAVGFVFKKVSVKENKQKELYEVLVLTRDETGLKESDNTLLQAGHVLLAVKSPHEWSDTEKTSYLILKMELTENEYNEIAAPLQKDYTKKEIKRMADERSAGLPEEERKRIEEELKSEKQTIRARKYIVDMEKLPEFDPNALVNGQPFYDETYDFGIMEKDK